MATATYGAPLIGCFDPGLASGRDGTDISSRLHHLQPSKTARRSAMGVVWVVK